MITRMTVLRGGRSSNDGSEVRPAPAGPRGDLGPSRRVPLPAAVVLGSVTCLVLAWGVSPEEVGRYALYLVLVVVLPGCAVWRACGPNLLYMSHELALGAAVGIALETAARLTASDVLGRDCHVKRLGPRQRFSCSPRSGSPTHTSGSSP